MNEQKGKVNTSLIKIGENGLELKTFDDLWYFAQRYCDSGLAPSGMSRPETVIIALQKGYELGLKPLQSLESIAVINGRACIWGDIIPGMIRAKGVCEYIRIEEIGEEPTSLKLDEWSDNYGFRTSSKRKNTQEEYSYYFTVADAKIAGLWNKSTSSGKKSVWQSYPKRMLRNRSRNYCLRDLYSDVLGNMYTAEEIQVIAIQDTEYEVVSSLKDKLETKMSEIEETPVSASKEAESIIESPDIEIVPENEPETSSLPESGDRLDQPGLFDKKSLDKDIEKSCRQANKNNKD